MLAAAEISSDGLWRGKPLVIPLSGTIMQSFTVFAKKKSDQTEDTSTGRRKALISRSSSEISEC